MFFLSVICQHSVLNELAEEPEVTEAGMRGEMQLCSWDTARRLGGKEREGALLNPSKLVGWLSPSCPVTHAGRTA